MLGDAMAVPLRAATLLHESAGAFDVIAEDAAGDAASLALAATEDAAFVAARSTGKHLVKPFAGLAHVSVALPHGGQPVVDQSQEPHVSVHEGGETKTAAAPSIHKHKQRHVDYDFFSGIAPRLSIRAALCPARMSGMRRPTSSVRSP